MQQKRAAVVWQALVPIAAGHFVAIGLVVAAAAIAGAVLPLLYVKIAPLVFFLPLGFTASYAKVMPVGAGCKLVFAICASGPS
jgi:hypothetical protein